MWQLLAALVSGHELPVKARTGFLEPTGQLKMTDPLI